MAKTFPSAKDRRSRRDRIDPVSARCDAIAARRVLRDCHHAVREFKSAVRPVEVRVRWLAALALLRSVGHVLDKVDGSRSTHLRAAINTRWVEVRSGTLHDQIFHDFIERERNMLLKEYRADDRLVQYRADNDVADALLVGTEIMSRSDALTRALDWWERLLHDIETSAAGLLRGG